MDKKYFIKLVIYLTTTLTLIIMYIESSRLWFAPNGYSAGTIRSELPLILIILLLLYFSKIKNKLVKFILPCLPVLIPYVIFDVFFYMLRRIPRLSDLYNTFLVFKFSPLLGVTLLMVLLIIPLSIAILLYYSFHEYERKKYLKTLATRMIIVLFMIAFLLSEPFNYFQELTFKKLSWSQERSIRYNGRFAFFFYQFKQEQKNYESLKEFKDDDIDIHNILYPGFIKKKRNIHIIVLESFIDPNMLKGIQANRNPMAEELQPYLRNGKFNLVISPAYGGGTSHAEFEILTGIKTFQKFGVADFNIMEGKQLSSFVTHLSKNGYLPLATIASGKEFYNAVQAYSSLGFDDVNFLEYYKSFKRTEGDLEIFDGDLFEYNLKQLKNLNENKKRPILNYVLGMYGHIPFKRNKALRPDIIELQSQNSHFKNIANQFYYRTQALGNYLQKLTATDPDSIILIISDHLPPIVGNSDIYSHHRHTNIALLINNSQLVDINGYNYYEIPWLIWDMLTNKKNKRHLTDSEMENLYYKALSESMSKK